MAKKKNKSFNINQVPKFWIFVAVFGVIGLATLAFSAAAPGGKGGGKGGKNTGTVYTFEFDSKALSTNSANTSVVQAYYNFNGGVSYLQDVVKVDTGGALIFGGKGGPGFEGLSISNKQSCYVMSATSGDSVVRLVNLGNDYQTTDVTVKKVPGTSNTGGDFWQQNCVPASDSTGSYPGYSLKHISGPAVLVHHAEKQFDVSF